MNNIRILRFQKGCTVMDVGKALDGSKQVAHYFENLDHIMPNEKAEKLCVFFGVNRFELEGENVLSIIPQTDEEWETFEKTIEHIKKTQKAKKGE